MTLSRMRPNDLPARILFLLIAVGLTFAPAAQAASGDWQPGPDAALDNTYRGVVDSPASGSAIPFSQPVVVSGWVLDTSADGWSGVDTVHVYEGAADGSGRFLGQATIAQSRPDVAQALGNPFWSSSGFFLSLAAQSLAVGDHTLTIYAHTPEKGWWSTQVSFIISPAPPPPVNVIVAPRGITIAQNQDHYTIKGYALDPSAASGTGIDHVDVYMDEPRGAGQAKFIGGAAMGSDQPPAAEAYGARFMGSGYSIDFKPSKFDPGDHHIYAYAVSSLTGQETLDVAGFHISDT